MKIKKINISIKNETVMIDTDAKYISKQECLRVIKKLMQHNIDFSVNCFENSTIITIIDIGIKEVGIEKSGISITHTDYYSGELITFKIVSNLIEDIFVEV